MFAMFHVTVANRLSARLWERRASLLNTQSNSQYILTRDRIRRLPSTVLYNTEAGIHFCTAGRGPGAVCYTR